MSREYCINVAGVLVQIIDQNKDNGAIIIQLKFMFGSPLENANNGRDDCEINVRGNTESIHRSNKRCKKISPQS